MLNLGKFDFEKIIKDKMEEERVDFLTSYEIIEGDFEDAELLLATLPLTNRKIPQGYILNPVGLEKMEEVLKNLESIILNSDIEFEIEIKAPMLDYDSLSINIKCDNFVITQNQKSNFLKILSLSKEVDIYARIDGKMIVSIGITDCLMPI